MPLLTQPIHEANPCHDPEDGEFAPKGSGNCKGAAAPKYGDADYIPTHDPLAKRRYNALERRLGKMSQHQREVQLQDHLAALRARKFSDEHIEQMPHTILIRRYVEDPNATPRPTIGQQMKARRAGMRRQRLAMGGAEAEKQRQLDWRMARGRQTQALIRAIRKREQEGG